MFKFKPFPNRRIDSIYINVPEGIYKVNGVDYGKSNVCFDFLFTGDKHTADVAKGRKWFHFVFSCPSAEQIGKETERERIVHRMEKRKGNKVHDVQYIKDNAFPFEEQTLETFEFSRKPLCFRLNGKECGARTEKMRVFFGKNSASVVVQRDIMFH